MTDLLPAGICIAGFLLLALLFFSGRGAGLIAGYNTQPEKERERYDRRALCRFTGWLMLYLAACTALLGADSLWPGRGLALAGRIWMPIGIVCAMIYANTGGRFLKK